MDAVSVRELLQAEGIDCWTGWDYIAGIPDPARRQIIVGANQLVLGGVVLNDAGKIEEARDVLRRAAPRPTSIVPVTATDMLDSDVAMSLASGDNSWAYFVVSPHPALFDPEAAEAALEALEHRHTNNIAMLDVITAKQVTDLELTARLRQWRSDFPPGELERLTDASRNANDKLVAAQVEAKQAEATLTNLQAERQDNRENLPALRAEVRALEDRHRMLAELARDERVVAGLERERVEAEATAEAQDQLASAAEAALATLREAQQGHRVAAQSYSASAERARSDLTEIRAGGEVTEDAPTPTEPVQVLRDRLDEAEKAYKQVEVGHDLREQLAVAQARLTVVQEEVTRFLDRYPAESRRISRQRRRDRR